MSNPLRHLPSVNEILQSPSLADLEVTHDHESIVAAVREEIDALRQKLLRAEPVDGHGDLQRIAERVVRRVQEQTQPRLRKVINATGIVLHTNLGRAPVAEEAARAAYEAARGYLNLELDLQTGKRSSRQAPLREWICRLTRAESATVVNNNAAATVIALRALCAGREVILSRGQLIEIGGSFRIPEIMAVSGATLREVGTTNITRLADFERAIGPDTAALMQIHTSNYRISGFTQSVPIADLVALGKKHDLKVIDDIGSGAMLDFGRFGLFGEPIARESIVAGADLVLFSGDKLLGGPQAGILAGKKEWIAKIESDPLMRAFRLDKMTLAALEATFRLYLDVERAVSAVPVLRLLSIPLAELQRRAGDLAERLRSVSGLKEVEAQQDSAFVGGGSLPDQALGTWIVCLRAEAIGDDDFAYRLRTGSPAVLGRLREGRVLLDVRTIFPDDVDVLVAAVEAAAGPSD